MTTVLRPSDSTPPRLRSGEARRSQLVRLTIGCIIAAAALAIVLRGIDIPLLLAALRTVHGGWVLIAFATVGFSLTASAVRWRLTFYPEHGRVGWGTIFSALLIGQMLNIVLPLRTGEIGRAYAVSASRALPLPRVLSTIAIERLSDLAASGTVALVLIAAGAAPQWLIGPGRAVAIGGIVAVGAAVVLALAAARVARAVTTVAGVIAPGFQPRLQRWLQPAVDALDALRNVPIALSIWLLAMVVTALAASTNYVLFHAFDLPLSATAALVLLVALQVGNALVSVPGNLGVFHAITVLVLTRFGVDQAPAVAYALVLYAIAIVPKIVLGAACLVLTRRDR